jgi:hypothetical protein
MYFFSDYFRKIQILTRSLQNCYREQKNPNAVLSRQYGGIKSEPLRQHLIKLSYLTGIDPQEPMEPCRPLGHHQ